MRYELEVGARSIEDALSAWNGGADRVELYVSPSEGALTPAAGLVRRMMKVKKDTNIGLGIFAMIRPRAGDFLYSEEDFNTMLEDTEILRDAGAEGFMAGIVTAEGDLDVKRMKKLLDLIPGKRFTLHRAFEALKDQEKGLEQAVDLGVEYILTGGMNPDLSFDIDRLRRLHKQAAGRIKIMVALGPSFKTQRLPGLFQEDLPTDFHIVNGYRKKFSGMKYVPGMKSGDDDYLMQHLSSLEYLEESTVREIRTIMDQYK